MLVMVVKHNTQLNGYKRKRSLMFSFRPKTKTYFSWFTNSSPVYFQTDLLPVHL